MARSSLEILQEIGKKMIEIMELRDELKGVVEKPIEERMDFPRHAIQLLGHLLMLRFCTEPDLVQYFTDEVVEDRRFFQDLEEGTFDFDIDRYYEKANEQYLDLAEHNPWMKYGIDRIPVRCPWTLKDLRELDLMSLLLKIHRSVDYQYDWFDTNIRGIVERTMKRNGEVKRV